MVLKISVHLYPHFTLQVPVSWVEMSMDSKKLDILLVSNAAFNSCTLT